MIVEIIDKLIDRFLQLIKHRKEQNQELYSSFVEPAFADFEAVHKNYMDSFKVYRNLLRTFEGRLDMNHPIFDQIKEDSLFSSEIRSKIAVLQEVDGDKAIGSFAKAVCIYILGQEQYNKVILNGYRTLPNRPRREVIEGLKALTQESVPEDVKKKKALETIDKIIEERQGDYHYVMREYTKLKMQLLSPEIKLKE